MNRDERLFDNKEFLAEVEKRPVIWDTTTRLYTNKQLKKEAWDELVDIFCSDPSKEERNVYCRTLQRKWKSARDCFNRECQRLQRTKQGLATSRKSPYIYYKNLSFLHKIMARNKAVNGTKNSDCSSNNTSSNTSTNTSSVSNADISVSTTDASSTSNTDSLSSNIEDVSSDTLSMAVQSNYPIEDNVALGCSTPEIPKRHRTGDDDDDDDSLFTRILQPNIQLIEGKAQTTESGSSTQEEDSDRLFLLSLHEPLKQVPKRLRMSVRVKIMQIVDHAMRWENEHVQE